MAGCSSNVSRTWRALLELLAEAVAGEGRLVLLGGEAGTGKTALKTVGQHMSSVLRKLDQPTPARAVAAAVPDGVA